MKKLLLLSFFVAGVVGGFLWCRYHAVHPRFPELPVTLQAIGTTTPEGTSSMSRNWSKGIRAVGPDTPCVWNYFQKLEVSTAPENSNTWDASTARHAHRGSTLVHRVLDYYHDLLDQRVPGGLDHQYSSLKNIAQASGTFYCSSARCLYAIDVWQVGFPPDPTSPVCISIMVVPNILSADTTAEQLP
jgi:hypothetical protein